MKNISVCILFFALLSTTIFAQSFIAIGGSASIPVGSYASSDLNNGCFTSPGVSFGVDGAWVFYKNFGIGADVGYSAHPVKASELATALVNNDPFLSDMYVRSDPYTSITAVAGPYYVWQLSRRMVLDFKALGGIMYSKTPFQLFEPEYFMVGPNYYKTTSSTDKSFAMKGGARFQYQITPTIVLGLSANYVFSKMSYGFYNSQGLYYKNRNISFIDCGLNVVLKI